MSVEGETDIERAGTKLRGTLRAEALLVTRGTDGMSFCKPEADPVHIPVATRARSSTSPAQGTPSSPPLPARASRAASASGTPGDLGPA